MSRYDFIKEKIGQGGHVYMPYVLLGFPEMAASVDVARGLLGSGAHGLELGFPFRDPVADGPVIERAGNLALENGFCVDRGFEAIAEIRAFAESKPLTLMLYYNMVLARGIDRFFADCKAAGLDGVLIPDMPPERADTVIDAARANGIELVFIVAPTTTRERMELIRQYAGGFIYVVTRMGLTGMVEDYSEKLSEMFSAIREEIGLPAIAGFGISTPDQARKMVDLGADGVITGSKIVEMTEQDKTLLGGHTRAMLSVCT